MSTKEDHINKSDQELLEKLLNGTLSDGERFELEKRALDDPMLFEALEGFQAVRPDESTRLAFQARLEKQFFKSKETGRIFLFRHIYGIAAIIVVLFTILFVIDHYIRKDMGKALAVQTNISSQKEKTFDRSGIISELEPEVHEMDELAETADSRAYINKAESEVQDLAKAKKEGESAAIPSSIPTTAELNEISEISDAGVADEDIGSMEIEYDKTYELDRRDNVTDNISKIDAADATPLKDDPARVGNAYIEGNVRDASGKVLKGAEVKAKRSSKSARTDSLGNFSIEVPAEGEEIEIDHIGYNKAQAAITRSSVMDVILNEGAAQSVVQIESSHQYNSAYPVIGFEAFGEYVAEHLIKPEAAIQNAISGTVSVEFTVSPYGKLSDFRILRSLGFGCDEEAVRLLKEGGEWETFPKFREIRTVYHFRF